MDIGATHAPACRLPSRWKRSGSSASLSCTRSSWPPRHFPPSRRQRRKPATILSCNQFDVSPYKSHRVMQYNTWKRVSPSNPVSSHPAFYLFLALSPSVSEIALLPATFSPLSRPLSFTLKHPKSCARRDRTHRKVSLVALSQVRIYVCDPISSDFHSFGTCTSWRALRWEHEGRGSIATKISCFLHSHYRLLLRDLIADIPRS